MRDRNNCSPEEIEEFLEMNSDAPLYRDWGNDIRIVEDEEKRNIQNLIAIFKNKKYTGIIDEFHILRESICVYEYMHDVEVIHFLLRSGKLEDLCETPEQTAEYVRDTILHMTRSVLLEDDFSSILNSPWISTLSWNSRNWSQNYFPWKRKLYKSVSASVLNTGSSNCVAITILCTCISTFQITKNFEKCFFHFISLLYGVLCCPAFRKKIHSLSFDHGYWTYIVNSLYSI